MPGHLSAAEAPEDLWRCHECGWTYPNHHPSAKHRRNHKKQCGTLPGFISSAEKSGAPPPHVASASSDDASSDEEQHHSSLKGSMENGANHQENGANHQRRPPSQPARGPSVEPNGYREGCAKSCALTGRPSSIPSLDDGSNAEESVPFARSLEKVVATPIDSCHLQPQSECAPNLEGEEPLTSAASLRKCPEGVWSLQHPHDGTVPYQNYHKLTSQSEEACAGVTKLIGLSDRSFDLSQLEPVAATSKDTNYGYIQQDRNFRSTHAVEGQWVCRHCGWTYPNAHPSAKHRRKHKKKCGAAASTQLGAGGSSDDASSDEEHIRLKGTGKTVGEALEANKVKDSNGQFPVVQHVSSLEDSGSAGTPDAIAEEVAGSVDLSSRELSDTQSGVTGTVSDTSEATEHRGNGTPLSSMVTLVPAVGHRFLKDQRERSETNGDRINEGTEIQEPGKPNECESQIGTVGQSRINEVSEIQILQKSDQECIDSGTQLVAAVLTDHVAQFISEEDVGGEGASRAQGNLDSSNSQLLGPSPWQLRSMKSLIAEVTNYKPTPLRLDSSDSQVSLPADLTTVGTESPEPEKINSSASHSALLGEQRAYDCSENRLLHNKCEADEAVQRVVLEDVVNSSESQLFLVGESEVGVSHHSMEIPNALKKTVNGELHPLDLLLVERSDYRTIKQDIVVVGPVDGQSGLASPKPTLSENSIRGSVNKKLQLAFGREAKARSPEPRSPPESPEGLVRTRVEEFEKLAALESRNRRKSLSPSKSVSPTGTRLLHGSAERTNTPSHHVSVAKPIAESDLHGVPTELENTISHLRHQQSNKRSVHEASVHDAPPELYDVMSHLRHCANVKQSESFQVGVVDVQ